MQHLTATTQSTYFEYFSKNKNGQLTIIYTLLRRIGHRCSSSLYPTSSIPFMHKLISHVAFTCAYWDSALGSTSECHSAYHRSDHRMHQMETFWDYTSRIYFILGEQGAVQTKWVPKRATSLKVCTDTRMHAGTHSDQWANTGTSLIYILLRGLDSWKI